MLPIEAWCIYYRNGTIIEGCDDSWKKVSKYDVEIIVWYHKGKYRTFCHGLNEYPWDDVIFVSGPSMGDNDWYDLLEEAYKRPKPQCQ